MLDLAPHRTTWQGYSRRWSVKVSSGYPASAMRPTRNCTLALAHVAISSTRLRLPRAISVCSASMDSVWLHGPRSAGRFSGQRVLAKASRVDPALRVDLRMETRDAVRVGVGLPVEKSRLPAVGEQGEWNAELFGVVPPLELRGDRIHTRVLSLWRDQRTAHRSRETSGCLVQR